MNKRLKKKLEKLGRLGKRNPAAFFAGEKRIVEEYLLLQRLDANHSLLKLGEVKEGYFKSKEPWKKPKDAIDYLDKLVGAAIELGALNEKNVGR